MQISALMIAVVTMVYWHYVARCIVIYFFQIMEKIFGTLGMNSLALEDVALILR